MLETRKPFGYGRSPLSCQSGLDKGSWGHDGDNSPAMALGELWTAGCPVPPHSLLGHLMSPGCTTLYHFSLIKVSAKLLRRCSRDVTFAAASLPSAFPSPPAPATLAAPLWAFSTCSTLLITSFQGDSKWTRAFNCSLANSKLFCKNYR